MRRRPVPRCGPMPHRCARRHVGAHRLRHRCRRHRVGASGAARVVATPRSRRADRHLAAGAIRPGDRQPPVPLATGDGDHPRRHQPARWRSVCRRRRRVPVARGRTGRARRRSPGDGAPAVDVGIARRRSHPRLDRITRPHGLVVVVGSSGLRRAGVRVRRGLRVRRTGAGGATIELDARRHEPPRGSCDPGRPARRRLSRRSGAPERQLP
jgi:hypothetical protein